MVEACSGSPVSPPGAGGAPRPAVIWRFIPPILPGEPEDVDHVSFGGLEGSGPVADAVLDVGGNLRHRPGLPGRHEDWVVPEAPFAPGALGDPPFAHTFENPDGPRGQGHGDDRPVPCRPPRLG